MSVSLEMPQQYVPILLNYNLCSVYITYVLKDVPTPPPNLAASGEFED